jgi:hypothetical protein
LDAIPGSLLDMPSYLISCELVNELVAESVSQRFAAVLFAPTTSRGFCFRVIFEKQFKQLGKSQSLDWPESFASPQLFPRPLLGAFGLSLRPESGPAMSFPVEGEIIPPRRLMRVSIDILSLADSHFSVLGHPFIALEPFVQILD